MNGQEMAERLAEESVKRFGFVVVSYKRDKALDNIGKPTHFLWKIWKVDQPFVPIRLATDSEWQNQCRLFEELFGYQPEHMNNNQCPLVLVTD